MMIPILSLNMIRDQPIKKPQACPTYQTHTIIVCTRSCPHRIHSPLFLPRRRFINLPTPNAARKPPRPRTHTLSFQIEFKHRHFCTLFLCLCLLHFIPQTTTRVPNNNNLHGFADSLCTQR